MARPETRRGMAAGILRLRCPRCRQGKMFHGILAMNERCPACGLVFEREPGYFMGAMYISYGISVAILTTVYFTAAAVLPGWDTAALPLPAMFLYLPLMPAVFRYSRVLWIYFDRATDFD